MDRDSRLFLVSCMHNTEAMVLSGTNLNIMSSAPFLSVGTPSLRVERIVFDSLRFSRRKGNQR
jgi:hypothetical protein